MFNLFLQACWFGDESSKRALVKFDLGRVSLASGADISVARWAVSGFTVCGDTVVARARPAEPCPPRPPDPMGPVVPAACCEPAPLNLLPDFHLPQHCGAWLLRQPDALMEERNWQGEAPKELVSREPG